MSTRQNADAYNYIMGTSLRAGRSMAETTSTVTPLRLRGYQAVRVIGTGAGSVIWEVRDEETGRLFALKRVIKNNGDTRFIHQVLNEYATSRAVDHPTIRKVYSMRKLRKLFSVHEIHMVMELCPGQSVQDRPPKDIAEACEIFFQVANAMQRLNEAGYVHADMKPNNIIVDKNDNVKIIDLGQCCLIGTIKDRIQGTPDFIAPEQVHRQPLDERTDVYNFGASLYWALTRKNIPTVLPQQNMLKMPTAIVQPLEIKKDIPPLLNRLVMDCIQLEPSHRLKNMQDIVTRLGIVMKKELATEVQVSLKDTSCTENRPQTSG
ncbi:MAG: serine/threonine protein kinase [Phycisphaerae bacterium]|nr:serine/threonine protein kinase [Phycisphaerae bacterium]